LEIQPDIGRIAFMRVRNPGSNRGKGDPQAQRTKLEGVIKRFADLCRFVGRKVQTGNTLFVYCAIMHHTIRKHD
jgi:hypothetical protein